MKCTTRLLLLTTMLCALTATGAHAETTVLPTVLLTTGTTNTLQAENATAKTEFTGIVSLTGVGYKFELKQAAAMTSLGTALLTFLKAELAGKKCKSPGDTAGTILIPGEWHTVLALGGGAKLFILLFLIKPALTMECEGTNTVITGSEGWDAEPFGTKTKELTATTGAKCPYNVYTNDSNEMITGGLKSETGGLKAATCLEVEGTQKYTSGVELEVMKP